MSGGLRPGLNPNPIDVVGVLDNGPESLTPPVLRLVQQAEVLAGGERHLAFFPDVPAERIPIKGPLAAVVERLRAAREAGRQVTVLASGDPLFYGIGRTLVGKLGRDAVRFHPNVSSMALAFARLGESWDDAVLASVHGRPAEGLADLVRGARKVGLFTDAQNNPAAIARLLLDAGVTGYRAHVCANLAGPEETVWSGDLAEAARREFPELNVLVLVKEE